MTEDKITEAGHFMVFLGQNREENNVTQTKLDT